MRGHAPRRSAKLNKFVAGDSHRTAPTNSPVRFWEAERRVSPAVQRINAELGRNIHSVTFSVRSSRRSCPQRSRGARASPTPSGGERVKRYLALQGGECWRPPAERQGGGSADVGDRGHCRSVPVPSRVPRMTVKKSKISDTPHGTPSEFQALQSLADSFRAGDDKGTEDQSALLRLAMAGSVEEKELPGIVPDSNDEVLPVQVSGLSATRSSTRQEASSALRAASSEVRKSPACPSRAVLALPTEQRGERARVKRRSPSAGVVRRGGVPRSSARVLASPEVRLTGGRRRFV